VPALSKKQRRAMAIAEHRPDELYAKNRGLLQMTKLQLHEFADTPERGLPDVKKKRRSKVASAMMGNK
jgi:hypothetical protein